MNAHIDGPPPLIAVCARVLTFSDEGKRDAFSSSQPYSRAVTRAGGVPVLVPPITELASNAASVLRHFDGVLLPGGGDVHPSRYGQDVEAEQLYGMVDVHDELDIAVALAAIEVDLPMLAVCRGMQVLNVALGGTLQQDIGTDDHWMREHTVTVTDDSLIAQAVGATHLEHCHSVHHQGIAALAHALTAIGFADDGLLEAVEYGPASWVVGIQWHAEDTASRAPHQQAIYDELVRRAAARRVQ